MDINAIITGPPQPLPALLRAPFAYIENIPGNNQNMRYRFLVAFNDTFFSIGDQPVLAEIGEVIAIFHNASLLIDDIEDASTLRRGQQCAHLKFGVPLTINCGNLMYFVALQRAITSLPQLYVATHGATENFDTAHVQGLTNKILVDEMLNLHHGQGLDICWRDNLREILASNALPSIEDYLHMVMNKTGGLFRLLVKLLGLFSDQSAEGLSSQHSTFATADLIPLANLLGIIYQIRDDYLNLSDPRYSEMKGLAGEDLVEGKLSLPVLYTLLNSTEHSPVHHILLDMEPQQRKENPQAIADAVKYMETNGAVKFTRDLLHEYVENAQGMLTEFGRKSGALGEIIAHLGRVE